METCTTLYSLIFAYFVLRLVYKFWTWALDSVFHEDCKREINLQKSLRERSNQGFSRNH